MNAASSPGVPGRRQAAAAAACPLRRHRGPVGRIGLEERRHARVEARLAAAKLGLDLGRGRLEDEAAAIGQCVAQTLERVPRVADDRRDRIEGVLRDEALSPERVVRGDARRIETEVGGTERGAPGPDGDVELEQESGGQQVRHAKTSPKGFEIDGGDASGAVSTRASCASARSRTRRTVAAETPTTAAARRWSRASIPSRPNRSCRTTCSRGPRRARCAWALAASIARTARSSGVAAGSASRSTSGPGPSSSCPSSATTVGACRRGRRPFAWSPPTWTGGAEGTARPTVRQPGLPVAASRGVRRPSRRIARSTTGPR